MPQAIAYIRVSDPRQVTDGNSLATQERLVRDFAVRQGYELGRVFIEPGESAKTDDRPVLKEMLSFCAANKGSVELLIIPKIDRLARNTYDYTGLKLRLNRYGVRLVSVGERIEDSPVGRFTESILASVAQFDNEIRGERCKGGMLQALREGRYVCRPKFGYRRVRVNGKVTIEPDPTRSRVLVGVFQSFVGGNDLHTVRQRLAEDGYPMSRSSLYELIRDRTYLGEMELFGERGFGEPPFIPLISESLYLAAQARLRQVRMPRTYRRHNPSFPLRGTVRCTCGQLMTASWSVGYSNRYPYYRCMKCRRTNLSRAVVHNRFGVTLIRAANVFRAPSLQEEVLAYWHECRLDVDRRTSEIDTKLKRTLRLQAALATKNAEGVLPDQVAREQIRVLQSEREDLELQRTKLDPQATSQSVIEFAFSFLSTIEVRWRQAGYELKQRIQRFFFPNGWTIGSDNDFRTVQNGLRTGLALAPCASSSAMVDHEVKSPQKRASTARNLTMADFLALTAALVELEREFGPSSTNSRS